MPEHVYAAASQNRQNNSYGDAVMKMTYKEWTHYVRMQHDKPKDRATYFRMQLLRMIPFSLLIAIIVSITIITFWSFKEWARMVLQLTLGITLAAAFLAPLIKRVEEKFK
jgi:hypothetical protein